MTNNGKPLNRIKVVLAEEYKINKRKSEKTGKGQATISKWCNNHAQPSLEMLYEIAKALDVDYTELLRLERKN